MSRTTTGRSNISKAEFRCKAKSSPHLFNSITLKKVRIYFILILLLAASFCSAQPDVKIYYEETRDGFSIFADSYEFCPVSVRIDFTLTNLLVRSARDKNRIFLINARAQKQLLAKLTPAQSNKEYRFSYKYFTNLGDATQDNYDAEYVYDLPYAKGNSFMVFQGYNGQMSHVTQNALDFTMPIGTEILAIREGTVVRVVDHNDVACAEEACKAYNNLVTIFHPDGTFVEYTHIKRNGSNVKVGDQVQKGQVIAYSGNVGWSTGPHLHLVVYLQKLDKRVTLQTKFRTGNGQTAELLTEKNTYERNY